jgi:hypothetical protein
VLRAFASGLLDLPAALLRNCGGDGGGPGSLSGPLGGGAAGAAGGGGGCWGEHAAVEAAAHAAEEAAAAALVVVAEGARGAAWAAHSEDEGGFDDDRGPLMLRLECAQRIGAAVSRDCGGSLAAPVGATAAAAAAAVAAAVAAPPQPPVWDECRATGRALRSAAGVVEMLMRVDTVVVNKPREVAWS